MPLQPAVSANCDSLFAIKNQLSELPASLYTKKPTLTESSIGVHTRHILEHYQMLFTGLPEGIICYDNRVRNEVIERSISSALSTLDGITSHLQTLTKVEDQHLVLKTAVAGYTNDRLSINTSLVRELAFIHSHTIHHQAIISMLLKAESIHVAKDFGVAPATLQFQRQTLSSNS
ncbi:hypothetical protein [Parendozoicomonas sp. Alg238-R29]|uniref:hypothetical protein n=1 Tax=Parendozoicomonas sp. Alg238-R29 TaxID=2993446 RepID=UPI00248DEDE4|nr:hypothetical protein [Parendozoicomonas sp. Alg238-R29]